MNLQVTGCEGDPDEISGPTTYGLMHDVVFTVIDANHHAEDWTFFMPGDKIAHARFDMKRTK